MRIRDVSRSVCMFVFGGLGLVTAASCGNSGSSDTFPDASTPDDSPANTPPINLDGGPAKNKCTPKTCAAQGYTCGPNSDGCGVVIQCGTCSSAEFCGGGGYSKCGNGSTTADGGPVCIPRTCASFPATTCGPQSDGCGGVTASCGTCSGAQFCGGGGPSVCGGGGADGSVVSCAPKTCADLGTPCGVAGDGCGGLTPACATCTSPAYCGGGGPGVCGGTGAPGPDGSIPSLCTPATCKSLGYNCGLAGDGCGGTIGPCGPACAAPQVCGAGSANVCGSNIPCTGLCTKQVACDGGTATTLTGVVRAGLQEGATSWVPAGTVPDPVPGVVVYIPTTALTPFSSDPNAPRVQCSQCGADVSGNPLVETTTDYAGRFTLSNVPVSANAGDTIPIVIQLGHWRRQYSFAILNPCTQNALPQDLNLPSKSSEGDIPLTAISTGAWDAIECVLLKMGVDQSEFMSETTWNAEMAVGTAPKQGRVHIYTATAGGGGISTPGSTLAPQLDETALMGAGTTGSATNGTYMMYDQILLPCWGGPTTKNAAELFDLGYYGDHGGHFFATHYSYSWLNGNGSSQLTSVANWDLLADTNTNPYPNGVAFTGNVSTTVPRTVPVTNPGMFVQWLNYVGALANSNPAGGGGATPPANPAVTITAGRHDVDSVANGSVDWIDGTDPNGNVNSTNNTSQMLLHFTFDMPIGATSGQCGHGIYSDFHVNSATLSNGTTFPNECDQNALNSQERIIEYMIWDLASCVPGPPTVTCTPKTCGAYPAGTCGQQGDGCGGLTRDCFPCPPGQTCGGAGVPGMCGAPEAGTCTPETCAIYPTGTCGKQSDGCGGLTTDCFPCPPGQTCGGGGVSGQCGAPPTCPPQPCPPNVMCGPAGDGCGGVIASCGTCMPPQTCGGGGTPGQCGHGPCMPTTCAQLGIGCGPAGDGCGNLQSCGTCVPPQTCGGGGKPGQCGGMAAH